MKLLPWLVVILATVAAILFALDQVNQSAAERAYAQAAVIRAQSQARLDATSAHLPYVIIGVSMIFGSALVVLGVAILQQGHVRSNEALHYPLIERQVIIVIAPADQPRGQMWRQISDRATIIK